MDTSEKRVDVFQFDLKSMKEDRLMREIPLDDAFFARCESQDIHGGTLTAQVEIRKVTGFFEVTCHIDGHVLVACDLCLDDMRQPILTDTALTVKLGEEAAEDDDLITLPEKEGILDIAWYLYEAVVLAVPIRHVHEEGGCNAEMRERLAGYTVQSEDGKAGGDPRWDKLKDLKL